MSIQDYTNIVSMTTSTVVALFMMVHWTRFKTKIYIPVLFALSGLLYNMFGSCDMTDMFYDVAITISMIILLNCHCKTMICTRDCNRRTF